MPNINSSLVKNIKKENITCLYAYRIVSDIKDAWILSILYLIKVLDLLHGKNYTFLARTILRLKGSSWIFLQLLVKLLRSPHLMPMTSTLLTLLALAYYVKKKKIREHTLWQRRIEFGIRLYCTMFDTSRKDNGSMTLILFLTIRNKTEVYAIQSHHWLLIMLHWLRYSYYEFLAYVIPLHQYYFTGSTTGQEHTLLVLYLQNQSYTRNVWKVWPEAAVFSKNG